jgi:hypothetical protein
MYPNQPVPPPYQPPQQQPPTQPVLPVDYLNQIAPQVQQKKVLDSMPKKILFFLAIAVILVLILVIVVNAFTGSQRQAAEELAARLTSTEAIAKDAQSNLKSTQMRTLNTDLRTFFTNTNRDIADPFESVGVNTTRLSGSVTQNETQLSTEMTNRLEDARLNAIYDQTYAREMAYQLATLLAMMEEVYDTTGSTSLKEYLGDAYENLTPIQEGFASYNQAAN